jgi:hypothetical protein
VAFGLRYCGILKGTIGTEKCVVWARFDRGDNRRAIAVAESFLFLALGAVVGAALFSHCYRGYWGRKIDDCHWGAFGTGRNPRPLSLALSWWHSLFDERRRSQPFPVFVFAAGFGS